MKKLVALTVWIGAMYVSYEMLISVTFSVDDLISLSG